MDQRFLEETVRRRPALFEAIVAFNRSQLRSAAASSSHSVCPSMASALFSDARIRRACVSACDTSVTPRGWWDFSEETRRLVLLSPEQLRRLALCFSAAVHAEELARILDRKQVLELRDLLGDDVFSYAIRRGRYQIGSLRQVILQYLPAAPLGERLLLLARAVLLLMGEAWPDELRRLWVLKLNALDFVSDGLSASAGPLPQLSREQRRALWFTLKKILLREAAPQWAPCFD
ncbi:SctK family type III secretion system sorting platform protein [Mailhella sp.]|uniref:SctK family type III secretion system sorting platform protein n=1 Tax=Mailhella sp. TaxID=1981029 RepID=UPI004063E21D